MLLGAEIFWDIVLSRCVIHNKLQLSETKLGWILGGVIEKPVLNDNKAVVCHISIEEKLDRTLKKILGRRTSWWR